MAYQASDLMADVIALAEQRWVSSEEIWKIATAMELVAIEQKIDFFESCTS
ncbi:TyeA family type III secretion system gatekeeper subunit [Vibrio parahaemolyticus]|nr:TyeA family type III secretion system gatekeeper subunit [Vibrio parahaemolyticus]MDN4714059.1 TyeA family type III secretion system gatekeeper subunit [Vibrio parahaemolyticus]MDN4717931.1 TyeA family type III secretion system gatekeeper subunit [Vibrio parahaemolyticus]MDN4725416.1 TyeA family type III secretion system gatekeeper subunit [Vibrio parahaemolyticus]